MRYTPILVSATTAALFITVLYGNHTPEELKSLLLDALISSSVGWGLLFVAHEDVRKIIFAVESHLKTINDAIAKAEETETRVD